MHIANLIISIISLFFILGLVGAASAMQKRLDALELPKKNLEQLGVNDVFQPDYTEEAKDMDHPKPRLKQAVKKTTTLRKKK